MERRDFIQKASMAAVAVTGGAALLNTTGCSDEAPGSPVRPNTTKGPSVLSWQAPTLLDYTIMPAKMTVSAWTDPNYKNKLLTNTTQTFQDYSSAWPTDREYEVVENGYSYQYLPLPYRKALSDSWTKQQVIDELITEMGLDDQTFECCLPPRVIAEAWFDSSFKANLLANPATAISSLGITPPSHELRIVESTASRYKIVLLINPLQQAMLNRETLLVRLQEVYGMNTSKCCQSGTRDSTDTDFPR